MYAGQIMEQGQTDEIFKSPSHPYTKKLLASVPRLDMNRSESLHSIEGTPPDLYIPPKGCPFYDRCEDAMKICKDYMPDIDNHTNTHYSRCWLNHPMAKSKAEGSEA
jgi:oligopeptide transport system ATP-binding protein